MGGRPSLFQAAGSAIPGAPKVTAVLGADYSTSVGEDRLLSGSFNYSYRSKVSYQAGVPEYSQGALGLINLAGYYGADDDKWRVGLYVRNATNQLYHSAVLGLPLARAGGVLNWNTYEGARNAGVSLELRY